MILKPVTGFYMIRKLDLNRFNFSQENSDEINISISFIGLLETVIFVQTFCKNLQKLLLNPIIHNIEKWLNIFKISWCEDHKIYKVCLVTFQHYE